MFHAVLFRSPPGQEMPSFVDSLAVKTAEIAAHVRSGVELVGDDDIACFIYDGEKEQLVYCPESSIYVDNPDQLKVIVSHILHTCRARIP